MFFFSLSLQTYFHSIPPFLVASQFFLLFWHIIPLVLSFLYYPPFLLFSCLIVDFLFSLMYASFVVVFVLLSSSTIIVVHSIMYFYFCSLMLFDIKDFFLLLSRQECNWGRVGVWDGKTLQENQFSYLLIYPFKL